MSNNKDVLLLPITPLTLGLRTGGGHFRPVIPRNTVLPCSKSVTLITEVDFQRSIHVEVLQGEHPLADLNRTLGKLTITGLLPAPKGVLQIKVSFSIDSDGILNITARELSTGAEQAISVSPGVGLSVEEIERLIASADQLPMENAKYILDLADMARRLIYVANNLLTDLRPRLDPTLVEEVPVVLAELQTCLGRSQWEQVQERMSRLNRLLSRLFLGIETTPGPKQVPLRAAEDLPRKQISNDSPFAGFYILSEIEGGMGKVFIVLREGQRYAVKTLRDELLGSEEAADRFVGEARTWIALERHSNIVFALLVKVIGGQPLLFLEYVDSGNLSRWVGKIDVAQAVDFAIQFCTGMRYAHSKASIVHRDIKPTNVLLAQDARFRFGYAVKITDFGLAAAWHAVPDEGIPLTETELSRGAGTLPYMPPEQFPESIQRAMHHSLKLITTQSDVYSFGVMLYELLTGHRPFSDMHQIFTMLPRSPREQNPDIPQELASLIMRCLKKDPGDRYSGFDEIALRLIGIYESATGESYSVKGQQEPLTHFDYVAKGVSMNALGDYEGANRCYESALRTNRMLPAAWKGMGESLECLGRYDEALQCFEHAIEANLYFENAWCGKARCFVSQGKFGKAVMCYEQAYTAQFLSSIGPG
jgi:tetratricopeptide (TPR) repeat protein